MPLAAKPGIGRAVRVSRLRRPQQLTTTLILCVWLPQPPHCPSFMAAMRAVASESTALCVVGTYEAEAETFILLMGFLKEPAGLLEAPAGLRCRNHAP